MSEPDWSDYSDVLDNREYDVAERANALAPEAETVRIAVGYFYLGGFDLLKENLRRAERIEILIGTDTDQRTIDELERGFGDDLDEYDRSEAQEGSIDSMSSFRRTRWMCGCTTTVDSTQNSISSSTPPVPRPWSGDYRLFKPLC